MTTDSSTSGALDTLEPRTSNAPHIIPRTCRGTCGNFIPPNRLAVVPHATMCVPCQEAAGDVPTIRMFTEQVGDEIVETMFISGDRRMERYIEYTNHNIAGEESFDIARGDDAHLVPEKATVLAVARPLSSVFEEECGRIKVVRKKLGATQKEFGEAIGCSGGTISYYENRRGRPTSIVLQRVANLAINSRAIAA